MLYRPPQSALMVALTSGWDTSIDFLVRQSQYYVRGMVCGLHATMFVPFLILFVAAVLHVALRLDQRGLSDFFLGMPMKQFSSQF